VIPDLSSLSVNCEHYFLRQIFRDAHVVPAPSEERNQLWRENTKKAVERIFVSLAEKSLRDLALW
jgi:hypothetical protein